uniref:hypothetical protein n=2 Tax=Streptococcus TaxID=1301 RepID=UPI0023B922D1
MNTILEKFYKDHQVKPFISPERDLDAWLLNPKPVPKRNMELLTDDLLAGDIILLWRIQFGTFTTETWFPKYFEYTYGIDAPKHLKTLVEKAYTVIETAFDSLDHLNATIDFLRNKIWYNSSMNYEASKQLTDVRFKRLVGVQRTTFEEML